MRRSRLAIVAGILLVIGLAVSVSVWLLLDTPRTKPAAAAHQPQPAVTPLPQAEVVRLERYLNSRAKQSQGNALAPVLRASYSKQRQRLLPIGVFVKLKPESMQPGGNNGAILEAGAQTTKYRLWLGKLAGHWYVIRIEVMQ